MTTPDDADADRKTERAVLAATILGSSLVFIDGSIVAVALPAIRTDLGGSLSALQWVVNGYALPLAAFILPGGAAGDAFGRRRVFLIGLATFALASLWCALARSMPELIAARAMQGFGGALLVPASLALISVTVPRERRGAAIGLWASASAIATAIGPVGGGVLIDAVSWRFAFLIGLPLAMLAAWIAWRGAPESKAEGRVMDWIGGVLACISLGLVAFALTVAGEKLVVTPSTLATGVGGLVFFGLFLLHQSRARAPMMPLDLFRSRGFAGANLLTLLLYGALSGVLFFLPIALIEARGLDAAQAGLAFLPFTALIGALSGFAGRLADRIGSRPLLIVGPGLAGVAMFGLGMAVAAEDLWPWLLASSALFGIGMGLTAAPLATAVMTSMEEDRAGLASGVNNAVARAAGLLAVAGFGAIATFGFRMVAEGAFGEREQAGERFSEAMMSGFWAVAIVGAGLGIASAVVGFLTIQKTQGLKG